MGLAGHWPVQLVIAWLVFKWVMDRVDRLAVFVEEC